MKTQAPPEQWSKIEKPCACGCGTLIPAMGKSGQPRTYVPGHQRKPSALEAYGNPTTDPLELAWAAGFFDGEGCTTTYLMKRQYPAICVRIGQNDRRALDRFANAVGLGSITGPDKKGCHYWTAYGRKVDIILGRLWPYLGDAKREQAQRAKDKYAKGVAA